MGNALDQHIDQGLGELLRPLAGTTTQKRMGFSFDVADGPSHGVSGPVLRLPQMRMSCATQGPLTGARFLKQIASGRGSLQHGFHHGAPDLNAGPCPLYQANELVERLCVFLKALEYRC